MPIPIHTFIPVSLIRVRTRVLPELLPRLQDERRAGIGVDPHHPFAEIDNRKVKVRRFLTGNRGRTARAVGVDLVSEIQVFRNDFSVQAYCVGGREAALPIRLEDARDRYGTDAHYASGLREGVASMQSRVRTRLAVICES